MAMIAMIAMDVRACCLGLGCQNSGKTLPNNFHGEIWQHGPIYVVQLLFSAQDWQRRWVWDVAECCGRSQYQRWIWEDATAARRPSGFSASLYGLYGSSPSSICRLLGCLWSFQMGHVHQTSSTWRFRSCLIHRQDFQPHQGSVSHLHKSQCSLGRPRYFHVFDCFWTWLNISGEGCGFTCYYGLQFPPNSGQVLLKESSC